MSRVKFNVGGTRYETSTATLGRYPESMLARMIQQPAESQIIENGGELFIDRDGNVFGQILDYLRHGDQTVLPDDSIARQHLLREADFFQLPGLINMLKFHTKFHIGDTVQLQGEDGKDFMTTLLGLYGNKSATRCCTVCLQPQKIKEMEFFLSLKSEPKWPKVVGRIEEIQGDCAMVAFPISFLLHAYDRLSTVEWDDADLFHYWGNEPVDDYEPGYDPLKDYPDSLMKFHIPLKSLKLRL